MLFIATSSLAQDPWSEGTWIDDWISTRTEEKAAALDMVRKLLVGVIGIGVGATFLAIYLVIKNQLAQVKARMSSSALGSTGNEYLTDALIAEKRAKAGITRESDLGIFVEESLERDRTEKAYKIVGYNPDETRTRYKKGDFRAEIYQNLVHNGQIDQDQPNVGLFQDDEIKIGGEIKQDSQQKRKLRLKSKTDSVIEIPKGFSK